MRPLMMRQLLHRILDRIFEARNASSEIGSRSWKLRPLHSLASEPNRPPTRAADALADYGYSDLQVIDVFATCQSARASGLGAPAGTANGGLGLMGARRTMALAELDEHIRDEVGQEVAKAERRETFFYVWRRGGVSINLKGSKKSKTKHCLGNRSCPREKKISNLRLRSRIYLANTGY